MKSYKILRIAGVHYFPIINKWLWENPKFEKSNYDKMLKIFFSSSILYSDGFTHSLRSLGQSAHEIIADFDILQKQWARENGIKYDPENWMTNILMAQIKKIKPEVIYFQGTEWCIPGRFFAKRPDDNLIRVIKETFPFIKKVMIYSGYPSHTNRIKGADIFFTSDPGINEYYQNQGLNSIVLYHSFDPQILEKLDGVENKYDFTFVGTARAPESRYWALRELVEKTSLNIWIYEPKKVYNKNMPIMAKVKHLLKFIIKKILGIFNNDMLNKFVYSDSSPTKLANIIIEMQTLQKMNPEKSHSPVMGMDMYNLLSQSKITFNKHADLSFNRVGNMRMFEATGVGTCLLTDTGQNMQDLFEPDKEVVTYSSVDEAEEKVNYLLDHPDEAKQIAKAGQARTLKDHTIMNRCQQIDEVIQNIL